MLMSSSKLFLFFERSSFKRRCETVNGTVLCFCHQADVTFLSNLAKLTVPFTCTSLPLNLNTSVFGCGCGFGFEQIFWRNDGFGEKGNGSDLRICIPLGTLSLILWTASVPYIATENTSQTKRKSVLDN